MLYCIPKIRKLNRKNNIMLTKIEITNFKSFNEKFTFDLSNTNEFKFNEECIQNGIVNTGIIYGQNGCGKSNLGFALFDLISHLTDRTTEEVFYKNYLNANNSADKAQFRFTFRLDGIEAIYEYSKKDYQTLVSEKLTIDNKLFASIDRNKSTLFEVHAEGTESLTTDVGDSNISILSYISKNSILVDNQTNNVFKKFKSFINKMLFFRNIDDRCYMGFEQGSHSIAHNIVKLGNLKEFENLLNDAGIKCKLNSKEVNGEYQIYFVFNNREIEFHSIASSGTKALALFYFWYQVKQDISFLFIDEFDAFYHHGLSRIIIEKLKETRGTQVILTTHNTSIISNDLLRPDCYFLMDEEKIRPLTKCTDRELREGHNIEKMYRANSFG